MKRYLICGLCIMLAMLLALGPATALAEENLETVFVLADALGQPRRVFVTERQTGDVNQEATEQVEDPAPLPVNVSIRYELDGEAIEPDELTGKSGHLKISINYESSLTGTVEVKGESIEMPIPFIAVTVLPLDSDVFSNVEVTNGRMINAGRVSAAVCYGLPGLREALNMGGYEDINLEFDIPTDAVISADVTDFTCDGSYTVVAGIPRNTTDKALPFSIVLKGFRIDPLFAKNMLTSGADDMLTGISELTSGAASLSSGASELNTGVTTLSQGLTELNAGSDALTSGADQMIDGIMQTVNETLGASADAFSEAGIELNALTLDNYADEIDRIEAAFLAVVEKRVYEQADATLEEQVRAAVREKVAGQVTEAVHETVAEKVRTAAREQVAEGVQAALPDVVRGKVTEAVRMQVTDQVTAAAGEQIAAQLRAKHVSEADIEAGVAAQLAEEETQKAIEQQVTQQMGTDEVKALIDAQTAAQLETEEVKAEAEAEIESQLASEAVQALIDTNIEKAMEDDEAQTAITQNIEEQMTSEAVIAAINENVEAQKQSEAYLTGVQQAIAENGENSEVYQSLETLRGKLDGVKAFHDGLANYTAGVGQAAQGAETLASGAGELDTGAAELAAGLATLNETIQTLAGYLDGDIKEMLDRSKAITSLHYGGYLDDSAESTVFIIRTEGF